jgi:hypothetical protein
MPIVARSELSTVLPNVKVINFPRLFDDKRYLCLAQPRLPDGSFRRCPKVIGFGDIFDDETGEITKNVVVYRVSCADCF